MTRKRADHLEPWLVWLRDVLSVRGSKARLTYDDKVAGDVLVLAIAAGERDRLVEITVTRRPKGQALLAVTSTTAAGAAAVHEVLGRLHTEVSRLANAKRKFVHRIERLVERLAAEWDERAADGAGGRAEALARLRTGFPEAVPMAGVGFHVDVAGAEERHTREVYPAVHAAAVLLDDGRWRGLAWDGVAGRWTARAATLVALYKSRPQLQLGEAAIAAVDASVVVPVAAAAVAATAAAVTVDTEVRKSSGESACSWGDAFNPCELIDCALDLNDLGNLVPDCSAIDCGAIDCGGLDCSL